MALKQKIADIESRRRVTRIQKQKSMTNVAFAALPDGEWREKVSLANGREKPWDAAKRGALVVYVDGSWSFLHAAQMHVLRESARRGDHLIVGVHSDETHFSA